MPPMTTARKFLIAGAAAGLLTALLAGCTGTTGAGSPAPESQDFGAQVLGAWGSTEPKQPNLEFNDDGTVTGTDGCNGIHSTYTVTEEGIEIEPFASTLKACQNVDDWLRAAHTVVPAGDAITVFNASGDQIGELDRS